VPNVVRVSRRVGVRRVTAALAAFTLLLVGQSAGPAEAAAGDVGFQGPSYAGTARPASADKPESKLWHAGGHWWAVMWDTVSGDWHIFRLSRGANTWVDTGVLVDKRRTTLADTLYDSTSGKLYVASHVVTKGIAISGNPARLTRYSLVKGAWKADAGFPSQIMSYSSESLTIDKDSRGNLWATWTQVAPGRTNGAVYVARGASGGAIWGRPFLVPAADAGANLPRPDDISTVVSFGKKVGVLWSNQTTSALYWSFHNDGASDAAWTTGIAFKRPFVVDDHINIKSLHADPAGRVYVVFKTNFDDSSTKNKRQPSVILGIFTPGRPWVQRTVWTLAECATRPVVVLNYASQRVYVMATAPDTGCRYSGERGVIVQKGASLTNPVFSGGRGQIIMRDADSLNMSNVTASKQAVDNVTGAVLLATNATTKRYWYSDSKATAPLR
jgi:hypothetical protein